MKAVSSLAFASFLALSAPVSSQSSDGSNSPTTVRVAYTASANYSSAFVAKEKGFFSDRGLDVELVFVPLNSTTLPAALQSQSIDIGGTTGTVMLQAVDSGLSLVAVAGGGVADRKTTDLALLTRSDLDLDGPADLVGKRIGTPGIGSLFYVLFRDWLAENDIDPDTVTIVEASYPTMIDVLRGGNLDAVMAGDPTMTRIVESGTGKIFAYFTETLPAPVPIIVFTATKDWVAANSEAAHGFRDAIVDGAAYIEENNEEARDIIAKYIDLPKDVIEKMTLPRFLSNITIESMEVMANIMKKQDMLRTEIDLPSLIMD